MIHYLFQFCGLVTQIHYSLMSKPIVTQEYFNKIMRKKMFDMSYDEPVINIMYRDTVGLTLGLFRMVFYTIFPNQKYIQDYNYIQSLANSNKITEVEILLKRNYAVKSKTFDSIEKIVKSNEFMNLIIGKTEEAFKNLKSTHGEEIHNQVYYDITRYVSGNCWMNSKLSNGLELDSEETRIIKSVNQLIDSVQPIGVPLVLFHGFERFTKYQEHYKPGQIINLPGFLSKTLSFGVAERFAMCNDWFNPTFIVVQYKPDSKHVHHDVRTFDNEFEFLTNSNEKLVVKNICQYPYMLKFYTFYICEVV